MIRYLPEVLRWCMPLAVGLMLASCSGIGNGLGGIFQQQCSTGTQQTIASPQNGQSNVSTSMGQVIVVANSNNNQLYNTYNQWTVNLVDNFGNLISGGRLALVPDPSGPHPYASDFYYSSSMPQLTPGRTYSASLLIAGGSCQAVPLGQFST